MQDPASFVVSGSGFDVIPQNAVGIVAYTNGDPLRFRYDFDPVHTFSIVDKSDDEITLVHDGVSAPSNGSYLGAILSADRSVVYWINNSRPLP